MQNPVRVVLVPTEVPADPQTQHDRQSAVDRLAKLGMVDDPTAGELNPSMRGWLARLDNAEFPVSDFAVQHVDGEVVLSLVFTVGSLSVGDPSTGGEQPQVRTSAPEKPVASWGTPGRPDPREGIPGWKPDVTGGSVTAPNTTPSASWKSDGDSLLTALRKTINLNYRGDVQAALGNKRRDDDGLAGTGVPA